ncbi:hypothetical protein ACN4EE_01855 [Geminocystis sp. CENA526]|uniref:hypothetical protein n=1 Tax=Geminocystis sp. CENA526 TaxID=1355871 RepID=UPI003D6DD18B
MSKLLKILSVGTILFTPLLIPNLAEAKEALCVVKIPSDQIYFRDKCNFQQYGGDGSFSIQAKSGLIADRISISVQIIRPGVADVRGVTTMGINSRWGEARRSPSDKACWVGDDFTICAY